MRNTFCGFHAEKFAKKPWKKERGAEFAERVSMAMLVYLQKQPGQQASTWSLPNFSAKLKTIF